MGERGPARTPTRVLALRASWRAKTRSGEVQPPAGKPRCPRWLKKEAKRAWKELVPQLEGMGILARCDRNAIARYCQTLAMWREANEWLAQHGDVFPERDAAGRVVAIREYPHVARVIRLGEQLLRLEKQFGLTPSARAGFDAPQRTTEVNQFQEWLLKGAAMRAEQEERLCRLECRENAPARGAEADERGK